ncbi:MAG: CYTH domain-containing protein [Ignavibacteriales bacterium]
MFEVEQRSFISKEKYNELINDFKNKKVKFNESKQITYYFKGDTDFRIMYTKDYTKMWLKKGQIHDDAREEMEVLVDNKYRSDLSKMLECLGYEVEIKWFRKRLEGSYQDIKLTIDYTAGYGYIVEVEKIVTDESLIDETKNKLVDILKSFNIEISDKQEFKDKYSDYKINWSKYTNDINEEKFLSE